jgi:hypothetical protein
MTKAHSLLMPIEPFKYWCGFCAENDFTMHSVYHGFETFSIILYIFQELWSIFQHAHNNFVADVAIQPVGMTANNMIRLERP